MFLFFTVWLKLGLYVDIKLKALYISHILFVESNHLFQFS